MLVTPEYVFKDVTHITPEWLAQKGIRALVLDIDNTLTADRSQELPEEVAGWLEAMRRAGVKLTIVSNGAEKRVRPFAERLGLAYLTLNLCKSLIIIKNLIFHVTIIEKSGKAFHLQFF